MPETGIIDKILAFATQFVQKKKHGSIPSSTSQ